jgi:hypothetical protein
LRQGQGTGVIRPSSRHAKLHWVWCFADAVSTARQQHCHDGCRPQHQWLVALMMPPHSRMRLSLLTFPVSINRVWSETSHRVRRSPAVGWSPVSLSLSFHCLLTNLTFGCGWRCTSIITLCSS